MHLLITVFAEVFIAFAAHTLLEFPEVGRVYIRASVEVVRSGCQEPYSQVCIHDTLVDRVYIQSPVMISYHLPCERP